MITIPTNALIDLLELLRVLSEGNEIACHKLRYLEDDLQPLLESL